MQLQRLWEEKLDREFEVDDSKKKRTSRVFEGKVKSYNEKRQLFRVQYEQFGDPKVQWGKTRAEVIEEIKIEALTKQREEVVHYTMTEAYERWYVREKVYPVVPDRGPGSRGRDNVKVVYYESMKRKLM
jgi:hypothetical protein